MDAHEILFIIEQIDGVNYQRCVNSIRGLHIPNGYTAKVKTWKRGDGVNRLQIYNYILQQSDAKYKIYISENTYFSNKNFLLDMLEIFKADETVGLIGVSGIKQIPVLEDDQASTCRYGEYYYLDKSNRIQNCKYNQIASKYETVQSVSNIMLATQHDLLWREELPDMELYYNVSCSMEFIRQKLKVVVPKQLKPWTLDMDKSNSRGNCANFPASFYEKYAVYMNALIHKDRVKHLLYSFGNNSQIMPYCDMNPANKIFIGDRVYIDSNTLLKISDKLDHVPNIIIEDDCRIGRNCTLLATEKIHLEKHVNLSENVYITAYNYDYASVGIPVRQQKTDCAVNKITIGRGTRVEANVVIEGNVYIGRGCLIRANSVIRNNIPDYCVVEGSPSTVTTFFDIQLGKWTAVDGDKMLETLIEKRKNTRPVLTIGIPTFNRSYYLKKCLKSIYDEIGDDPLFEIFVSDNCSEDDTPSITKKYKGKYSNFRYSRNIVNLGPKKNFKIIWENAIGEYVIVLGDDDYFSPDTIYNLVHCIYSHRDSSIISLLGYNDNVFKVFHGRGINEFIRKVSFITTYISALVMRRDLFEQVDNKDKFCDTLLEQVYMQLSILEKNPNFSILYGAIFKKDSGESVFSNKKIDNNSKENLCRVFIQEYFDILNSFLGHGLDLNTLHMDKKNVLENMILPWLNIIKNRETRWKIDNNIMEIYSKYYKDEPYYEEGKEIMKKF
ncbi:glycosyltransferase [Pectinatus haikarae]|uniref:Acetyltransferase-like isoleucine patch superfamily enzyme/glycosyltransferase involved in cell wall biosynthesis n=1 Tax=Pectinatus haikarae TaxID=349096 RepID=A0ABT9YBF3_9FIRM|nr:glycosyltransferase [Pectinatus haikarae]MDQ0205142.1 acetyltransferase-like isoleucine patch superfamily enzyme/glycosyltransferase involved in cell wall biosynthesis [Pectinatus haikarae]